MMLTHHSDTWYPDGHTMTVDELQLLVSLGLLAPSSRTEDGTVTEYRLTHAGRVLTERAK